MKVASYNIHKCRGTDGQMSPERIIAVIKELDADLVALQEVDQRFGRRLGLLNLDRLQEETGLNLLVQSDRPNGHGWHGNALLVRGTPKHYHRTRLTLPGIEPRGAVMAELDLGQGMFRVIGAHLGLLRRSRVEQMNTLLATFRGLQSMPTILLGDFNEWRRGSRSSLDVLAPVFGATHSPPSFPSRRPLLPLDRALGWPAGTISNVAVHESPLSRVASDHLPLMAYADIRPALDTMDRAA